MTRADAKPPVPAASTLGDRLRQLRIEVGLTQADVAERCGVSDKTVSAWETNTYQPRGTSLDRLAKALNRDRGELEEQLLLGAQNQSRSTLSPPTTDAITRLVALLEGQPEHVVLTICEVAHTIAARHGREIPP